MPPTFNLKKSISRMAMFSIMHYAYGHEVKMTKAIKETQQGKTTDIHFFADDLQKALIQYSKKNADMPKILVFQNGEENTELTF